MASDPLTERALAAGREQAAQVLAFRVRVLEARGVAIVRTMALGAIEPEAPVAPALVDAAGPPAINGVLVAEGDSWFHYPWTDVLSVLEDSHSYEVESVAHWGDRVEDMAYGGGQLDKLTRTLEKLLRRGVVPKGILLSGGGNDIAGDEFGILLNHAQSPTPGLNDAVVGGVIDQRIRFALVTILSAVTGICEERLGKTIPILVHGYDYPVSDGRGFLGGWWILPGPWLDPGFRQKGYEEMADRLAITKDLIDRFNALLVDVAAIPQFRHVRYVDLRNTLPTDATYKQWWDNELHPTKGGFMRVAERFAFALAQP